MKAKLLFVIVALSIAVFAAVGVQGDLSIKVMKEANIPTLGGQQHKSNEMQDFSRFIADMAGGKDIAKIRKSGCRIIHKLKGKLSFECPKNVKPPVSNSRKARIFHITDLNADEQIEADKIWADGINGSGVGVVVLDTGVDATHPELEASIKSCVSFVPGEDCNDYNGHGTHVRVS